MAVRAERAIFVPHERRVPHPSLVVAARALSSAGAHRRDDRATGLVSQSGSNSWSFCDRVPVAAGEVRVVKGTHRNPISSARASRGRDSHLSVN